MPLVVVKTCDLCGVDDSLRSIAEHELVLYRNGHPTQRTTTFFLCNACDDKQLERLAQTLGHGAKWIAKRRYQRRVAPTPRVPRIEVRP